MSTWIDLTDFLQWKGNLTGIQRIQFNLSKLYIESKSDVKFFIYQETSRRFVEVGFVPDEIVKSGVIVGGSEASQTQVRMKKLATYASRARARAFRAKSRPDATQHPVSTPFSAQDMVLVMGGIWVGGFIGDLRTAKKEQGFKFIHFAFDMIPSLFPGFVVEWLPDSFTQYQKEVFAVAEGIVAISESTANDVRDFMKEHDIHNKPEITVVRIGETIDELENTKQEKPISNLDPGFILSVSTIEARKNHTALFYMVREAYRRGVTLPKIVIVGRNGWHTDDFRYMVQRDPIVSQAIIIINDADDATLAWLYRNCLFTVFPSFYEGWGMPIAESLAYGKLCLSSNTSSMPEIAGRLIDYFSPYDTGALLDVVVKYLNPKVLAAKEISIKRSYKPTSWREMFAQTAAFVDAIQKSN